MSECNAQMALARIGDAKDGDGYALYHIPGTKRFDIVWERTAATQTELATRPHLVGVFSRRSLKKAQAAIGKVLNELMA